MLYHRRLCLSSNHIVCLPESIASQDSALLHFIAPPLSNETWDAYFVISAFAFYKHNVLLLLYCMKSLIKLRARLFSNYKGLHRNNEISPVERTGAIFLRVCLFCNSISTQKIEITKLFLGFYIVKNSGHPI